MTTDSAPGETDGGVVPASRPTTSESSHAVSPHGSADRGSRSPGRSATFDIHVCHVRVGDRVRLTGSLFNPGSPHIPVEDLPVGSEGTVTLIQHHPMQEPIEWVISVNWDCGAALSLLEPMDDYEIITTEGDTT